MHVLVDKTDADIKNDVLAELDFEPTVKVTDIGVLVSNGVVTLNGYALGYGEKWNAVHAAKRVAGVKAIADEIVVKQSDSHHRTDGDIAAAAVHLINWSTMIPHQSIEVTVRDGQVTLEGRVEWWYQRDAAESAVQHLAGVKGVTNFITILPKLTPEEAASAIQSAFKRSALLDSRKIQVETSGNQVVLLGKVRNHAEREEAERIAWAASGVLSVDNQLSVAWSWAITE